MHIKNIHSMIEKLSEVAKCELDKGIENIDTKEMGEVAEMLKELCEAEYYGKISKAMEESEYDEDYDYEGRKGYRGQPRDSMGRFMSRRGRRGYESNRMMPIEWDDMEQMRDMDRNYGRMYYSGGGSSSSGGQSSGMSGGQSSGGSMGSSSGSRGYSEGRQSEGGNYSSREQRDGREGRSGQSRRGYMEAKEMGKDKQEKMKNLEEYTKELSEDVTDMVSGMSQEEKTLLKNKLSVLVQKIQ